MTPDHQWYLELMDGRKLLIAEYVNGKLIKYPDNLPKPLEKIPVLEKKKVKK